MDNARRAERGTQSIGGSEGHTAQRVNVGDMERLLSMLGGAVVGLYGLHRLRISGLALAAIGGALAYRGLSGYCKMYGALGIDRASTLSGETRGQTCAP